MLLNETPDIITNMITILLAKTAPADQIERRAYATALFMTLMIVALMPKTASATQDDNQHSQAIAPLSNIP